MTSLKQGDDRFTVDDIAFLKSLGIGGVVPGRRQPLEPVKATRKPRRRGGPKIQHLDPDSSLDD